MEHVVSRDGIQIAFERSCAGHPLVLVHGTGTDHSYWAPVLPELERHFTVYAVDRRGRGQSGDVSPYAIEREFADVAALVDSIAEPVCLFGHSYGALCSVEAALLTTNIRTMVLYKAATETLCAALGQGRIAVLPEQGHEGVITAPGLVLQEVLRFCPDQTGAR